jgi:hypothetical protein
VTIEGITGVNRDIVTQTITVVVRADRSRIHVNVSLPSIERRHHQLLLDINAHFAREPTSADTRTGHHGLGELHSTLAELFHVRAWLTHSNTVHIG